MKTKHMKLKKQLAQRAQDERRFTARLADLKQLRRAVWLGRHPIIAFFAAWFGYRAFDWEKRYSHKYTLGWARKAGWTTARLQTAVEMVDQAFRVRANRVARVKDAIRRRGQSIIRWNRRIKRNAAATGGDR